MLKRRYPSPAIVIALIALFVALTGTALGTAKLQGATPYKAQVTVKTGAWALAGNNQFKGYPTSCGTAGKAVSGGWSQTDPALGGVLSLSGYPMAGGKGWKVWIWNITGAHNGTTYVVCVK